MSFGQFVRRLSMVRLLRLFMCLLFLPLTLVVTMPGVASAGVKSSLLKFHFQKGLDLDLTCQLPTWIQQTTAAPTFNVSSSAICNGGPDVTPGYCQIGEGDCGNYSLEFVDFQGEVCASGDGSPYELGESPGWAQTASGLQFFPMPVTSGCVPDRACLSYSLSGVVGSDGTECVEVDFEIPDAAGGTCPYGSAGTPSLQEEYRPDGPVGTTKFWQEMRQLMTVSSVGQDEGFEEDGRWVGYWLVTGTYPSGKTIATVPQQPKQVGSKHNWFDVEAGAHRAQLWEWQSARIGTFQTTDPDYMQTMSTVLGVGIFRLPPGANVKDRMDTGKNGFVGRTNAAACTWYWGDQIRPVHAGQEGDEIPGGPIPVIEEPEVPPDPEDPGVDEPPVPDDEPGFWGAILSLLKALISLIAKVLTAIGGLAAAIVKGITQAIKDLFIPKDGFFENKIDGLEDAADGTKIGNMLDAFRDLQPSSATGCEGPAFSVPVFGSGGEPSHPMSACTGPMSTLAGTSRLILTISISVGAALACIRVLGRGFGWDPGLGGGGS